MKQKQGESRAIKRSNNGYEPQYSVKDAPKIKTVGLRLGVKDLNLEVKVRKAFDLAKSAGRELDLTFGPGRSAPSTVGRLYFQ